MCECPEKITFPTDKKQIVPDSLEEIKGRVKIIPCLYFLRWVLSKCKQKTQALGLCFWNTISWWEGVRLLRTENIITKHVLKINDDLYHVVSCGPDGNRTRRHSLSTNASHQKRAHKLLLYRCDRTNSERKGKCFNQPQILDQKPLLELHHWEQ